MRALRWDRVGAGALIGLGWTMFFPQGVVAAVLSQFDVPPAWFLALNVGGDEQWLVIGFMVGVGLLLVDRGLHVYAATASGARCASPGRFRRSTARGERRMCLPGTVEAVREASDRDGVPGFSRRAALAGGGAAALAALLPGHAAAHGGGKGHGRGHGHGHGGRAADLTHVFRAGFPVYEGAEPARFPLRNYVPDGYYSQGWTFGEHSSTHMDAPGHFVEGGRRTPELRPEELFAPIAVIDISARAARNPDAEVTADDIRRHERRHGRLPRGAAVLMRSGWDAKAGDRAAFLNPDAGGTYHFPGFAADAAEYLLTRTRSAVIGVDTISLDPGNSTTFPVHLSWLGADRYGLEGLANLAAIPPRGATLIVGVIPWEEGSGGPCRVLARY